MQQSLGNAGLEKWGNFRARYMKTQGMLEEQLFSAEPCFIMNTSFSVVLYSLQGREHLLVRSLDSCGNDLSVVHELCVMSERGV